jgi:hypothetical protein
MSCYYHSHLIIPYLAQIRGFWVTCGVKMMSLCHGWGWQPHQSASHIHIRHIQSVWAHWYAVHGHTVSALHSYTHPTWLRFWGLVTCAVKMMSLCHGWSWQPNQTAPHIHMRHLQNVWACWYATMGIQYQPYTVIPTLIGSDFGILGHLWSQNDAIMS